jgi:hypothetical protein
MSTITPSRSPQVVRQQEKKELQVLNTKLEQYGAWHAPHSRVAPDFRACRLAVAWFSRDFGAVALQCCTIPRWLRNEIVWYVVD